MPNKTKCYTKSTGHKPRAHRNKWGKRPLNYLNKRHELKHAELKAAGDWLEDLMLTLCPYRRRYDPLWMIDSWAKVLKQYYPKTGDVLDYHLIANRGASGMEQCSAHIMFEKMPADLTLLCRLWEEDYGKVEITDAGGETSFYIAKNEVEPDPYSWSSKWRSK